MTSDGPQMLVTEFEERARHADRSTEGARLEFINGHLGGKAVPDGDHGRVIQWLTRICMQHRPDLWLDPTQGLVVEACRGGRARPDGSLAPSEAFVGQGEWADPAPVLPVVEVTSYDSDTDRRERVDKPRAYAETGKGAQPPRRGPVRDRADAALRQGGRAARAGRDRPGHRAAEEPGALSRSTGGSRRRPGRQAEMPSIRAMASAAPYGCKYGNQRGSRWPVPMMRQARPVGGAGLWRRRQPSSTRWRSAFT